jgi:hypothetical protein
VKKEIKYLKNHKYNVDDEYIRVFKGKFGSYLKYPIEDKEKKIVIFSYFFWVGIHFLLRHPMGYNIPWIKFHGLQIATLIFFALPCFIFALVGFTSDEYWIQIFGYIAFLILIILKMYSYFIAVYLMNHEDYRIPRLSNWIEKKFV